MAYDTKELYDKAIESINKHNLFFIEDVIAYLGIAKSTYYEHFPEESNESNAIKELIEKNKVVQKVSLRKKWKDSESAALQLALYKIIGTDEEAHRLNGTKQEVQQKTINQPSIDYSKYTDEELKHLEQLLAKGTTS